MYTRSFWEGRSETSWSADIVASVLLIWKEKPEFCMITNVIFCRWTEKNSQNETVYENNLNFWPNFSIILASIK